MDFRNIGVREFGVIYEGLLESELSVADQPLTVDDEGHYVPVETGGQQTLGGEDASGAGSGDAAEVGDDVEVEAGEVYLHGQSGERKATGTYYTKTRFVEHLLDHSLEPALDEHVERLERLAEEETGHEVADAFFDVRVADIAMGSGHFLVGAVDRIEKQLMTFLSQHDVPAVEEELDRLRAAAEDAFESSEEMPEVERSQLLRRQVARRCVFGVDLNPLATELARLSIWVHTFVPGLPLTFLDYNLTTGDSLAGIGTLDEVSEILDMEEQTSLGMFMDEGADVMEDLEGDIEAQGRLADADARQVEEARKTRLKIARRMSRPRAAFDILAASRIDEDIDPEVVNEEGVDLTGTDDYRQAQEVLESTDPLHFPAAFPEVFMGEDSGFDVIVGNPPWEESTLEEKEFWARYIPGLQAKAQTEFEDLISKKKEERPDLIEEFESELNAQQKRSQILKNGPYPGVGSGGSAPDTYLAFCWRFWDLIDESGYSGVVLPRGAFSGDVSEEFRRHLLTEGRVVDLMFLINNKNWVFPDVHPQYTIGLLSFQKERTTDGVLPMRGPCIDESVFDDARESEPHEFDVENALEWTGNAALPILPARPVSIEVFGQIAGPHPSLNHEGAWHAYPTTELNSGTEKTKDDGTRLMHFVDDPPEGYWPVLKGKSFDIWKPDTGVRYAWADPEVMTEYLQSSRESSYKYAGSNSKLAEMSEEWVHDKSTLPCYEPRVVFRDVARSTDSRTLRCALVRSNVFLTDIGPYFLWPEGTETDEAYLLGVLASIPLDWYARRFVAKHVTLQIARGLPIPRPGRDSDLRKRVVELSGRLAAVDDRYADWADAVGVDYGPLDDDEEQARIHELDAVVAHLYGLSREHLQVVFETFHDGWDHEPRLNAVLEYYDEWAGRLDAEEYEHLREGHTTD